MKIFKKYIAAMLIFALALSLCSCSLIDRLKPAPAPETVSTSGGRMASASAL